MQVIHFLFVIFFSSFQDKIYIQILFQNLQRITTPAMSPPFFSSSEGGGTVTGLNVPEYTKV